MRGRHYEVRIKRAMIPMIIDGKAGPIDVAKPNNYVDADDRLYRRGTNGAGIGSGL
jgi:hypothetical protein